MPSRKKFPIALAFLSLLVLTLAVWFFQPRYRRWSVKRAAASARMYLTQTNYANAALSARRALQIDSNCVAACQVLADLLERSRSSRAVQWRQKIAELEPVNDSNQLALARTALLFDQSELAWQSLIELSPATQRTNSEYHDLAAQIAFARHDLLGAERHLDESCRLDPTSPVHRHNLQIVRLHSSDTNVVLEARRLLDASRHDQVHGTAILRALVRESVLRGEWMRAEERSLELQQRADHEFSDRLLHLTLLSSQLNRPTVSPPHSPIVPPSYFHTFLSATELEAGSDPDRINTLASWLIGHGYAELALTWLESFPEDIQNTTPIRLAEAESYLARRQWAELRSVLERSHWDSDEHLRHALLALIYRQQGDEERAHSEWKHAVRSANTGASQSRLALVRLAGAWSWEEESEQLLWSLAGRAPENRWALALLRQAYEMGRDTRALARVFQAMLRSDPVDPVAQNNLAATSLLLRTNLPVAHQLALQAYAAQPTNASMACTYAYSMHLQGRTEEGLRLLSKLPEAQIQAPTTAAYYGLLLSASGAKVEAEKYLSIARKGYLLPEERAFVDEAAR